MPHVNFDPDTVNWQSYFSQTGGYFVGRPYQRGGGIGSVFSSLFRFLLPVLKSAGKELGKEGLAVGSRILNDVAQGKNARSAVVTETAGGLRNLLDKSRASDGLRNLIDEAEGRLQKGGGKKKKRKKQAIRRKSRPVKRSGQRSSYLF
jgi:hypothetical protein